MRDLIDKFLSENRDWSPMDWDKLADQLSGATRAYVSAKIRPEADVRKDSVFVDLGRFGLVVQFAYDQFENTWHIFLLNKKDYSKILSKELSGISSASDLLDAYKGFSDKIKNRLGESQKESEKNINEAFRHKEEMAFQAGMEDKATGIERGKSYKDHASVIHKKIRGDFSDKEKVKLAKAYLDGAGKRDLMKSFDKTMLESTLIEYYEDPCQDGYTMVGMKTKDGEKVPNCVPEDEVEGNYDPTKESNNRGSGMNSLIERISRFLSEEKDYRFEDLVKKLKHTNAFRDLSLSGMMDEPDEKFATFHGDIMGSKVGLVIFPSKGADNKIGFEVEDKESIGDDMIGRGTLRLGLGVEKLASRMLEDARTSLMRHQKSERINSDIDNYLNESTEGFSEKLDKRDATNFFKSMAKEIEKRVESSRHSDLVKDVSASLEDRAGYEMDLMVDPYDGEEINIMVQPDERKGDIKKVKGAIEGPIKWQYSVGTGSFGREMDGFYSTEGGLIGDATMILEVINEHLSSTVR